MPGSQAFTQRSGCQCLRLTLNVQAKFVPIQGESERMSFTGKLFAVMPPVARIRSC